MSDLNALRSNLRAWARRFQLTAPQDKDIADIFNYCVKMGFDPNSRRTAIAIAARKLLKDHGVSISLLDAYAAVEGVYMSAYHQHNLGVGSTKAVVHLKSLGVDEKISELVGEQLFNGLKKRYAERSNAKVFSVGEELAYAVLNKKLY